MTKNLLALAGLVALASAGAPRATAQDAIDTTGIHVKKAIADTMTPEQLQAYKERLAQRRAAGIFDRARVQVGRTPADTCAAATFEIGTLPYPATPANDTTVGATDNFDLPPDVATPTCTASTNCTGAGPAGSLPRGAVYTGTGTAPDRGWKIRTSANCDLTINMDPTGAQDLALIVYQATCSNLLSDCVCVDDTGVGGVAESVLLNAVGGTDYFIVVDGYSTGGTPPGPSGPYTLQITGTGCTLVPVELQKLSIE